jgi:hypothetical protein
MGVSDGVAASGIAVSSVSVGVVTVFLGAEN